MPKKFKISENDDARKLFIDNNSYAGPDSGYISYRMVLCCAIYNNVKRLVKKEEILNNLNELLENIETRVIRNGNFFETYPLVSCSQLNEPKNKKFIFVIDKTEGCYPLVLHDNQDMPEEYRIFAFKEALDDVIKKFEDIFECINSSEDFDQKLHGDLQKFFNFK